MALLQVHNSLFPNEPTEKKPMDRKTKLIQQRERIEAQLRDLNARERLRERKDDTRRKIIAGALALEHAGVDQGFHATLQKLLNRYVVRAQDRALFDLPPRASNDTGEDESPPPVPDRSTA